MKIRCLIPVSLLILTLGCLAPTHAAPPVADARARAQQALELMKAGDFEKFLDYFCPTVIEDAGGREKSIALGKADLEANKAKGRRILSVSAGDPGEPVVSGGKTFVFVPVQVVFDKGMTEDLLTDSWLAIADGDGSWLFIDAAALTPEKIKTLVPDLPASMEIPKKTGRILLWK